MSIEDFNGNNWPISPSQLEELCEWLLLNRAKKCDGTLRRTKQFLRRQRLRISQVIRWLEQLGGYCDCEVVLNVGLALWS
jgi:hypothetical protein